MVRLCDLIDLNEDGMTRRFLSHTRHGGREALRDRLEQPVEAFHSFCNGENNALCTCHMTNDWTEENCYVNEAPMKTLISEELSRRPNTGQNAPSIVARLMGLDMLSTDTKPSAMQVKKKNEKRMGSFDHVTHSSGQKVFDSFDHNEACNFDRCSSSPQLNKPKPREHPQEEELQKFKKDFEAWQETRLKECSKFVELGTNNTDLRPTQQRLNKEKLVLYANSMRKTVADRPEELKGHAVTNPHEICILKLQQNKSEFLAAAQKNTHFARNIKSNLDFQKPLHTGSGQRLDIASAPAKIVILRPAPDRTGNNEESLASSPSISEDGSSIEEFLHEVKGRLKCELQGKRPKKKTKVGGIETSSTKKPSDAKKIAQCIAKQVRDSVTRDVGMTLPRSESMRSYRSDIQCAGNGSPEFTNAKRFSTEMLRNVLREEVSHDNRKHSHGISRSAIQNKEKSRAEEIRYSSNKVSHRDYMEDESDIQRKYFRQELSNDVMLDQELFHRNLVRSLSAPVSRTSFGKLLLEDQNMLTGAHIRRKHEAPEQVTRNVKRWRKEKFNIKQKVSRFKYSFVLRGRLFGRKIQSLEESYGNKQIHMKDNPSTPTVASKFYERHENYNEVPPSPASVCSTTNEEFWRQTEYLSPSSASDVHPLDDSEMPHVFKEISSNLNELRRQLNQLETCDSDETMIDEQPVEEDIMEIDNPAEAFIRDLLVASGLYDGSCDKYISKWDPLGKPVSNQVLEEVKASYRQMTNDEEGSCSNQLQKLNHKLLCDFLNEVLPHVLGVPSTVSNAMKRTIGPTARTPRGKKLLDCVWEIARVYVYPPPDMLFQSLEKILARDLKSTPWAGLFDGDVNALGKDIEYQITGDLIHEIVNDMQ